ncbi:helix-turn-helix transcriptional regulator [Actinomycetospora sp. TBRC 11914]|uniref:helix-turn-helix transcriptional regulator n=1 Tax=Actinomycetospora sp. TBRC 11914 TaxID=2729387 RepID=UPI00145E8441|nr:helix-turn-helix transcriptional regulator [Actinomycetospora sp. TBRC 11914]NMO89474.1 helix-turn-helix transcriptional regulator [Actinomycetospora sp. TBRC 11914]
MQPGDPPPSAPGARPDGTAHGDPMRGIESALEELGDALREAQRSLDVLDVDGAATTALAGSAAGAEENRAIRLAYAQLAAHGARELREELTQVRARAAAMARRARELRARPPDRTPSTSSAPESGAEESVRPDADGDDTLTSTEQVVERAVAFVVAHAAEDIGVEDIGAAAGVGARRLQEVFRTERDTTPTRFLRGVRLERAHADLAATDPAEGGTVAEVAARWGFAHPGRFAGLYRRVFGCHPRYTLDTPPPRGTD